MTLNIKNECNSFIAVCIDGVLSIRVGPHESKRVEHESKSALTVSVRVDRKSRTKDGICNLVLASTYLFADTDDFMELSITREKIRVSFDASYERLFVLCASKHPTSETTRVADEESIKKRVKLSEKLKLFYDPVEKFIVSAIGVFIIGILVAFAFGWKIAFIYYPCAFLLLFGFYWLANVLWKVFTKKADQKEKHAFYQYFDPRYISQYYATKNREPFMGKIDTK